MLKLLEEARLRAFWRPEDGTDAAPTAVFDMPVLDGGGTRATLIARQEIEYLRPVPYRQRPLDVQLWIGGSAAPASRSATRCSARRRAGGRQDALRARVRGRRARRHRERAPDAAGATSERAAWAPFLGEPIAYAQPALSRLPGPLAGRRRHPHHDLLRDAGHQRRRRASRSARSRARARRARSATPARTASIRRRARGGATTSRGRGSPPSAPGVAQAIAVGAQDRLLDRSGR